MKKRLFCILALLLGLTLCACGGAATEIDEADSPTAQNALDDSGNAEGQSVALEYDLAVQMTLQSDFTLYLDNDMNLVSIEAGDEDGKNLLSGLDFAGKPYAEGMGLVLNAALEQGILADQGNVYFTVTCDDFSTELMETLFAPVMQFEQDNGVFIFIDWEVTAEEEPDYDPNYLYGTQRIKEEVQTIYIDRWESASLSDGTKYTHYNYYSKLPDPNIYHGGPLVIGNDLDSIRIKTVDFFEDGDWRVTYFEDAMEVKSVSLMDGKYSIFEYENRAQTHWTSKEENGLYSFFEYENDIAVRSTGFWTDGTQSVQNTYTFHSNGNAATSEEIGSDGSFSQKNYDENGNLLHIITKYTDGTYSENKFENGQPVYDKTVHPDGTYVEGYCENGNWTWTEGVIEPSEPES